MTIKFEQTDIQANQTNVLNKIVQDKRLEVAERKQAMPQYAIEPGLTTSSRNFFNRLKTDYDEKGAGFILEIKKASPSKGLIRENFDLDEICEAYRHYASCVSVLTDEKYFQGDFERLPAVREKLNQPLLCKDFFVDPYQVYLARFYGADAILLMLSVLDDETYQQLANVAKEFNMDILTEVSNEQEMTRAVKLNANIIGINNRNLRDLTTNLEQTPKLVDLFTDIASPAQQARTLLISESGIYTHQQVKQLSKIAHGFLVGSSLMAKQNLKQACRQLIVGEIKVCGITNTDDLVVLQDRNVDYAGLITVAESKRFVSDDDIGTLLSETSLKLSNNQLNTKLVMVTRDLNISDVVSKLSKFPIFAVQLHGSEDQTYIDELKQTLQSANLNTEIWKAIGVSDVYSETNNQAFTELLALTHSYTNIDRFVFDTSASNGQSGGTGRSFNWDLLDSFANNLSMPSFLIAGGINLDNAERASAALANGFDLNSGVESQPGNKSAQKIDNVLTHFIGRYEA
ncbi:bifunctional indole-3-glycerol-phosphate synthase TrpC/phosphoribosylanthranilate isomerase TrpF [Psychrosphaera ytuae]|uniref:Multifunctional fusion protein n=1 Tax=Psychrosphaera ytuae TaxID=2820710 RepID=A0A975HKD3_9GAMM|nr:bifunctional indole-3-glycerol-phosphate synthase TrpC/phosphoribosylanthranilate isomerase TrpF [Psychrosphaera ytuae]QTH64199.1 bifunctional indole-3-glycerol-phosphate synthase TrpC/phosphoribosylanthranilate isomerase TrpF [Psychrosphaera ytuae]